MSLLNILENWLLWTKDLILISNSWFGRRNSRRFVSSAKGTTFVCRWSVV